MYVLTKTHKFDPSDLNSREETLERCKVRPIVSCCGSPTEKMSYVCTTILSPLLNKVPSHLQHIHKHLQTLQTLTPDQLKGLSFFSADVVSLYTNIDIACCIDDIIEFAAEHLDELDLWGLTLTEVHQILDLVLSSSYFVFDNRLYQQMVGLFMGCMPSPIGAVVRVYMFEKRSVYTDVYFLSNPARLFYGRYMDDVGSLAGTKDQAQAMLDLISAQDPHGLLKWEIDFPDSSQQFVPFLSTQIRIDEDGILHYKYYRKSQKKNITLHQKSHHKASTKLEVCKNFYKTARDCSSSPVYVEESYKIIDKLLLCNGYSEPRSYINSHVSPKITFRTPVPKTDNMRYVCLTLPYISETICHNIKRYILTHNLPIRVIFKPGNKLRDLFCSSRPYDKRKCTNNKCIICPSFVNDKLDCQVLGQ